MTPFFHPPSQKKVHVSQPPVLDTGLNVGLLRGLIRGLSSSRYLAFALGLLLVATVEGGGHSRSNVAYAATRATFSLSDSTVRQDLGAELLISQAVPEIQMGDRGSLVDALQQRLTELGYFNGSVTGYFGEITEAAVIQFQNDHGLTADGIVGSGTTNALRKAGSSQSQNQNQRRNNPLTLEEGDQGPAVETLQNQLTTLGYYDGPISGYFGPLTENALIRFQRDKGLVADGVVGTATQSAIDRFLQGRSSSSSNQTASTQTVSTQTDSANPPENQPNPNDGVWEVGETGDSVEAIQRDLRTLGYYSRGIDGDYGIGTEAAVVAFQEDQNLNTDGKVGPVTLAALRTAMSARSGASSVATRSAGDSSRVSTLPPVAAASTPSTSSVASADPTVAWGASDVSDRNVLAVQRQLQEQGYYTGALDGDLGPATRRAIQSVQQTYGLQRSDFDE